MIGQYVPYRNCMFGPCLGPPIHLFPALFYKVSGVQKDYLAHLFAAYKTAKSLQLPSSRAVSCKSLSLVRDQKNHLLPGARAELLDESQFIYLTLSHLPDAGTLLPSRETEEETKHYNDHLRYLK